MIITCEECSTRFTLDDSLIKPAGSKVRCSHCKHVFTAFPVTPETVEPQIDIPGDIEFEEPDLSGSDELSDDITFDVPDIDQEPKIDFSDSETVDFDDQDIEFDGAEFDGGEFDGIEFEEAPDFSEPDFSDSDPQALETDIEMESSPGLLPPDPNEDMPQSDPKPEPDGREISLELEDSDLDFGDDDLELDSQDLEFDGLELLEDDDDKSGDSVSLQKPKESSLELTGLSLERDDFQDDDGELEEIEFETEEDVDLELVFDDDPGTDLVFEEVTEDSETLDSSGGSGDAFDTPSQLTGADDFETELELAEEPDFILEAELSDAQDQSLLEGNNALGGPDGQKFTDYDAVLDQDSEPPEVSPEQDDDYEPEPDFEIREEKPQGMDENIPQSDDLLIGIPSAADARKKRAKKSSGRIGAPVKILFLLFVLVIVAYVASLKLGADIPYLSNINIPYITDALKPAPALKPPLKPVPNEASINGRFISNTSSGELFIVTGRVENPSTIAYSHIKVKGTLLTKDKTKSGTQTAYCGNIISDDTLKTGNISDITQQLALKQGMQNTNADIKPGGSVMFMLVFSNLPENLTNFTVEVVDFQTPIEKK